MNHGDTPLTVGGQAVLEGVMMRSPHALAIAVRRPDGTVLLKDEPYISWGERHPALKRPFLRGPVILMEAMVTGVQALTFSAQAALQEEERDERLRKNNPWAGPASFSPWEALSCWPLSFSASCPIG